MHLKSITLKGFKSFPDRTRLEFGPGVSVIVGPNGSGKSNITDAVLWAMGEQSPLAVRGQAMQDVIFGGARGQQARPAAEVEVVIDNSDGALPIEFTELSILRRLDRSGEGEYRVNGARCRLVDVLEALSDTGLGKESHSIVSQGRVEGIVTSKPKDRRLLIEEAAGLGKHRKRRRRAQLKLKRTEDNLDRSLDVEREARARLRPLKRQSEAAELHARLERQATEARWTLARDEARVRGAALAEAEQAAAAARAAREEVDAALREVAAEREAAEQSLATRGAEREILSRRLMTARAAGERIALRLEHARGAEANVRDRAARARARLRTLDAEIAADAPDDTAAERIASLEAELERLARDAQAEIEREVAALEQRRLAAAEALTEAEAALDSHGTALKRADHAAESARAARREAEQAADTARREAARVGGELAAVNHFLRAHTGAPGGAPALADELDVDGGLELALAAALGRRMRAAIAPDLATGATLLDRAGADGGSALIAGAQEGVSHLLGHRPPPVEGAERLLDHVRGPAEALELARALLADAWVVESLETLPIGFTGIAVTRGGRVWFGATRELRQVPAGGEDRVLSERNRREELIAASAAAAGAEQDALAAIERAAAEVSRSDRARTDADEALRAAVRRRDECAEEERRAGWLIEQRREASGQGATGAELARVEAALGAERRLAERAEAARAERARRVGAIRAGAARDEQLAPEIAVLAAALAVAGESVETIAAAIEAELEADRAAGERLAAELRACAQREAERQGELRERGEAVTMAEVRAQQTRDAAAEADHELEALAGQLGLEAEPAEQALPDAERADLELRIERLARRREQLGPVNPLAKQEYDEALEHVQALETQREDLETALRELRDFIKDTDRRIRESFEETFAAAAKNFEEVVGDLFPGGRGRLRLVREDAGPRPVLGGAKADGEAAAGAEEAAEAAADAEEPGEDGFGGPDDDLGVEIEMTPAGKSMKRLSLLSGGEKSLTALAFLFAIFLARPCPFYVLDEVEAALDDLNIDRFLTLLRKYAGRAQFIVVTHQKRTMEAADALYGVSMGGDGVSKVVSRRLPGELASGADAA
jgi:chromosome segregation protein